MPGTIKLWNVTLATKNVPTNVCIYSKLILPGQSVLVDADWVHQYPTALQRAIQNKQVVTGAVLPEWYNQKMEEKMPKRLLNKGTKPLVLGDSDHGFSPTMLKPGEHLVISDESAVKLQNDLTIKADQLEIEELPALPPDDYDFEEAEETSEVTEAPAKKTRSLKARLTKKK